jgi:N-acetylmuramoyl-L-alanine amidase
MQSIVNLDFFVDTSVDRELNETTCLSKHFNLNQPVQTTNPVRYQTLQLIQKIVIAISVLVLVSILLVGARLSGANVPGLNGVLSQALVPAAFAKEIALISGHAGNDSGAVCADVAGNTLVTEAEVNAAVAEQVARQLRRAGADVLILEEFDPRLSALQADVLVSLHADSCIDATGYKAAHQQATTILPQVERLVACLDQHYPIVTGLAHHPNTITHNMTDYHAFRVIDPQTPAAIIELGFLGGDQDLLVNHPDRVAQGVTDGILCFLQAEGK